MIVGIVYLEKPSRVCRNLDGLEFLSLVRPSIEHAEIDVELFFPVIEVPILGC